MVNARFKRNLGKEDQCTNPSCRVWYDHDKLHVCAPRPKTPAQLAAAATEPEAPAYLHPLPAVEVTVDLEIPLGDLDDDSFLDVAFLPILPILVSDQLASGAQPVTLASSTLSASDAEPPQLPPPQQHVPLLPPQMVGHPDVEYRQRVEAVMRSRSLSAMDIKFIHTGIVQLGLSG